MASSPEQILRATAILEAGGVVSFPTETVYGLGADAENLAALGKVYAIKNRPADHPLIVHVGQGVDIGYWVKEVPAVAQQLIEKFWPGPLTLILERSSHVSDRVSGGRLTLGIRSPNHPVAQELLRVFKKGKGGIAAPSANRFGHLSPTMAHHVEGEFGGQFPLMVLDGGQSVIGIESTIVDLSRLATMGPVLLRPGQISALEISQAIGMEVKAKDEHAPQVSGMLASHYAPRTPAVLVSSVTLPIVMAQCASAKKRVALMEMRVKLDRTWSHVIAHRRMATSAAEYAHDLYAVLRVLDEAHSDLIVIEAPPNEEMWQAVNDRLQRAVHGAAGKVGFLDTEHSQSGS
jgi:L-threonylcarbamoyladenylate synthase